MTATQQKVTAADHRLKVSNLVEVHLPNPDTTTGEVLDRLGQ